MQVYAVVSNSYGKRRDIGAVTRAGSAVEFPGVPRTYNCVLVEGAVCERGAAMRA